MLFGRPFLATIMVVATAGPPGPTRFAALGIITEADGAYLSDRHVSAGTTLYDGDRLATEPDGVLRVRSGTARLYLPGDSQITLRGDSSDEKCTLVELTAGTVVFSTAQAAAAEVHVNRASVRAAADGTTVGQVTAVAPKLLYVYARRNALRFSYGDESEMISEGEAYRVVLDPTEDDTAAKPDSDHPKRKPDRRRRGFLFFLIGAEAVAAAAGGRSAMSTASAPVEHSESPFQP